MKTLLVEDDPQLGASLQESLRRCACPATWVRSAEAARPFLTAEPFDVVLLDIVLPGESGLQLLAWMRGRGDATPVIMLTARDAVTDRVHGLDGGADDYLAKPFAVEELLSRMRAVARRLGSQRSAVWRIGRLTIDTAARRVRLDAREVMLSRHEYDILVTLAAEPGKVQTRHRIERSYGRQASGDSNSVDVHVHNLRRKLGSEWIGTVRGVGYVLEPVS